MHTLRNMFHVESQQDGGEKDCEWLRLVLLGLESRHARQAWYTLRDPIHITKPSLSYVAQEDLNYIERHTAGDSWDRVSKQ